MIETTFTNAGLGTLTHTSLGWSTLRVRTPHNLRSTKPTEEGVLDKLIADIEEQDALITRSIWYNLPPQF